MGINIGSLAGLLGAAHESSDAAGEEHAAPDPDSPAVQQCIEDLRECLAQLTEEESFSVGDIIRWRPLLRNRRGCYDDVFIVVEVLDEPIIAKDDESGSTYYREPLDIVAGKFTYGGDFITFHYDSRRFTKLR